MTDVKFIGRVIVAGVMLDLREVWLSTFLSGIIRAFTDWRKFMLLRFFALVQIFFIFCAVAVADEKSIEDKQFGQWKISKCSKDKMTDMEKCNIESVPFLVGITLIFSLQPFTPIIVIADSKLSLAEVRIDKNSNFSIQCKNEGQGIGTCIFERSGKEIFSQMRTGNEIMVRITKNDGKQSIITLGLSEFRMALDYIKLHFRPSSEGFAPLPR